MTITGGSLTGGAGGGGGTTDNVTDTHIPVKLAGAFEDSPLTWSGVPGENIISSETIEVPPGTIQVGEGMKMSAAGVIPIFNSLLTGKTYIPALFEYDEATGSSLPFYLRFALPEILIVQPDFSTSTPLTGMFINTASDSEFILNFTVKTDPSASLTNVRLQFVAQSTGEPIFYFPSKAGWEDDEGSDLTGDGTGNVVLDFGDAPLGLLAGEVIDVNYKIDSGVLYGDGVIPYQELTRQVVEFIDIITADTFYTNSVSTTLKSGGEVSQASATEVDIAEGTGDIVSESGEVTAVSWDAATVSIGLPSSEVLTLITVDSAGSFVFYPPGLTEDRIRDVVVLGYAIHLNGTTIDGVFSTSIKADNTFSQLVDLLNDLGVTRTGGGLLVTGNSSLTINKTAGGLVAVGAGNAFGNRCNNCVGINGQIPATFRRVLLGTGEVVVETVSTTLIDNGFWDNGSGTKQAITGSTNQATNVYLFQGLVPTGGLTVAYGQNVYPTLQDALVNSSVENIAIPSEIADLTNLIAVISITVDCIATNDEDTCVISRGPKFGVEFSGGAGVSGGGGDVLGPASSTTDQVTTYADSTGKSIKSGSGITALAGVLQAIAANSDLILKCNGNGDVGISCDAAIPEFQIKSEAPYNGARLGFYLDTVRKVLLEYDGATDTFSIDTSTLILPDETRLTVPRSALIPSATVNLDFSNVEQIYTLIMDQDITFTFSNVHNGHAVQLELEGDFVPTFVTGFNRLGNSFSYNNEAGITNIIYFFVAADGSGVEQIDYTITSRE